MTKRDSLPWLLFDWGDTLMRVFPLSPGPMHTWPRVEAMPGAIDVLAALRPNWQLALATNAADSHEADIWAALQRVGLDALLDRVYCFRKIGHRKPAPEFYTYILEDLGISASQAMMVGDDFDADVLGANQVGMYGVWINEGGAVPRSSPLHETIQSLDELPALLAIRRVYLDGER